MSQRGRKSRNKLPAGDRAVRRDSPPASHERILACLRQTQDSLELQTVAERLRIEGEHDLAVLRQDLDALCQAGQITLDRREGYALVDRPDLIRGRIQIRPTGFAWLIRDGDNDEERSDLHIHAQQLHSAMDGDLVLARIAGQRRDGKPEGVVTEILERAHSRITGRYVRSGGVGLLEPANRRIPHEILIAPEDSGGAQPGSWVEAVIKQFPDAKAPAWGRIERLLDDSSEQATRVAVVLSTQGIPQDWPQELDAELAELPEQVGAADAQGRVDLRDLDLVTIDGEDARDFDDALYCEAKPGGGWRLLVAIADVSHYVRLGTLLDQVARERGNSVYLPTTVVPMLPERLSNDLCSLRPCVERLCLVCEMTVSAQGRLGSYRFFEGIMNSSARLTYTRVARLFEQGMDTLSDEDPEVTRLAPRLHELQRLYRTLLEARQQRGALDFSGTETELVLNDAGQVIAVRQLVRNEAHRLVEECMIAANIAAARFLDRHKVPGLYRIHSAPSAARLEDLRSFLAGLGVSLPAGDSPVPGALQQFLGSVVQRPDCQVIETALLQTMQQARYAAHNDGHFGLALMSYTHFTSPIRRYADLLVHRAIRQVIRSKLESPLVLRQPDTELLAKAAIYPYDQAELTRIGAHISATERRADAAGRDLTDWLKSEFMAARLGENYAGTVVGVLGFGLFVELDGFHISGLIHVSMLPQDYYHFEAVHRMLVGNATGLSFGLGDRLQVRLARVDVDARKIDLEFLEVLATHRPLRDSGQHRKSRGNREQRPSRRSGRRSRRRG